MNFIFLGPPGAGKGSLAVKVAEDYKIPHISTGDIFRAAIKNQTELGKKVKAIIDSGALVSDDLTCELVKDRLSQPDTQNGFILDGFPRTIPQAEMFTQICSDVTVVNFQIADEAVITDGKAIFDNASYYLVMGLKKQAVEDLSRLIDLNENEKESIKRYSQGEALFVCGSRRMRINVVVTKEELDSFGTGGGF